MNKIGIIALLPEEVRAYHRDLRQKIGTQFGLDGIANPVVPAHITIKYPFLVEDLDKIEKAVQDFCLSQSKLSGWCKVSIISRMLRILLFSWISFHPKKFGKPIAKSLRACEKLVGYNGGDLTTPIYTTMSLSPPRELHLKISS
jgi:hypothetical protein